VPQHCPPGTFSNQTGAVSLSVCTPCPSGAYCSAHGASAPQGDLTFIFRNLDTHKPRYWFCYFVTKTHINCTFVQVPVCRVISAKAELRGRRRRALTTPPGMALAPWVTTVGQGASTRFPALSAAFAPPEVDRLFKLLVNWYVFL